MHVRPPDSRCKLNANHTLRRPGRLGGPPCWNVRRQQIACGAATVSSRVTGNDYRGGPCETRNGNKRHRWGDCVGHMFVGRATLSDILSRVGCGPSECVPSQAHRELSLNSARDQGWVGHRRPFESLRFRAPLADQRVVAAGRVAICPNSPDAASPTPSLSAVHERSD